jgi:hypothetical protein
MKQPVMMRAHCVPLFVAGQRQRCQHGHDVMRRGFLVEIDRDILADAPRFAERRAPRDPVQARAAIAQQKAVSLSVSPTGLCLLGFSSFS